jgi:HEAT repeat protein
MPNPAGQHRLLRLIANESTDREVVYWSLDLLKPTRLVDDAVIKRLSDPSSRVRSKAAEVIQTSRDLRGLKPLIHMVEDPSQLVQRAAISALGALPDIRAVEALWQRLVFASELSLECAEALVGSPARESVEFLRKGLSHPNPSVRIRIASASVSGRNAELIQVLLAMHDDPDAGVRRVTTKAFATMCGDEVDYRILSRDMDRRGPWLDPHVPIDDARVGLVARTLHLPQEDIRRRYEALASRFPLRLAWKPGASSETDPSSRR